MAYSVQTLLTDLASVVHGTTVNKVPNVYGHINRAARQLLLDIDPKETQRIVSLPQVFNSVFDYPAPVDLKGDRIVDIRPQAGRTPSDLFVQDYAMNFDANKSLLASNAVYTQWNTGVKTLRIEAPTIAAPLVITSTGDTTGWSATAGAQNITLDTSSAVAGAGAIQFDLAAGSATGSIQVSSLSAIDVTSHVNIDTLFFWVYLPSAASVTSLNLKWGSDYTANYYTLSTTTTQQGTAFQDGWNLIALQWSSATKEGNPVSTAYDSVQLTVSYDSTLQTGLKFCSLTSNPGEVFQIQYYSNCLFRNPLTNAFQETVVDSSDDSKVINLATESYNLLFNKTAYFVCQALQGADAGYDTTFFDSEYEKGVMRYKGLNPAEAIQKAESYYTMPRNGSRRF